MTLANKITIARGLLIPVFVGFALYYGQSVKAGEPALWLRIAAIATFVIAAGTDALDGWIARKFNQRSKLGQVLDPIVDKGLMLAAMITLAVAHWEPSLPLWFVIVVISRDAVNVIGTMITRYFSPDFHPLPHWTGKTATALQMTAIAWVMLAIPVTPVYVAAAAGLFTLISGGIYLKDGVRHLQRSGHAQAP